MEDLRVVVRTHPTIDNHAHNLLKHELQDDPKKLLSITSEAQDDALEDSVHALAHMSARRQLSELYGCDQDDWRSLTQARSRLLAHPEDLFRKCFHGTHAVLMDDGLDADTVYPFDWHDQWTPGETKRIVRIEALAETIMRDNIIPIHGEGAIDRLSPEIAMVIFGQFRHHFEKAIRAAVEDDRVVGFKSVICYRSGLSVDLSNSPLSKIVEPFADWLATCMKPDASGNVPGTVRLDSKPLNDWLVISALSVIAGPFEDSFNKPIQFHTGLGDNDIDLLLASPAYLQPLISQFSEVPIVLLHASYPYTREAGYLATVYSNCYLDLGLVFPMISRAGQESVLRQALELTPCNKLLFSTDGHWFPETYYLASRQFRAAFEEVLVKFVEDKSLSIAQAIQAAKDILFNNSNRLYNLGIDPGKLQVAPNSSQNTINNSLDSAAMLPAKDEPKGAAFRRFLLAHPSLAFVYVQWFDYMGTMRARILPVEEFKRVADGSAKIGMSRGNSGTLQNDFRTPAVDTTGVIYIVPDLDSLKPTHKLDTLRSPGRSGEERTSATVMSSWCDANGNAHPSCARQQLIATLNSLKQEYGINITLGFEIEVTFLDRTGDDKIVSPVTKNHAWGTLTPEQWHGLGAILEVYDGLKDIGIEVIQMHAESGQGQYEFVLPPASAVSAIDTLLQARQVIRQVAYKLGLRATLHPALGNGAHVHMGLNQSPQSAKRLSNEQSFFAGVLEHMSAVCAFTLPETVSYSRVAENHWSGGTWVAWGTQNRECPLRRVQDGRWEYRALDGMANAYLAVGAIMGAGLLGLRDKRPMTMLDCAENPGMLTDAERSARGIKQNLPKKLDESLSALRNDTKLKQVVGQTIADDYIVMKETEQSMLGEMSEEDRHQWLIERY